MGRHGSKADLVLSKQGGGIFRQRFGVSITVGGEVVDTYFKWDDTSLRVSKIQLLKGDRSGKVEANGKTQNYARSRTCEGREQLQLLREGEMSATP